MINLMDSGNSKVFDGILSSLLSVTNGYKGQLNVFVLTMDLQEINPNYKPITPEMNQVFNDVVKKVNEKSSCRVLDLTESYKQDMDRISIAKRFTPYALLRLYSAECPDIPDKVLYLDTDTMARLNIEELYNIDIDNYELAGSRDYFGRVFKHRDYINSGVLLLNMKKIRETGLFKRAKQMCIEKRMFLADQDAINKCVTLKLIVDDKFNHQRRICPNTVIRHYCNSFRFFPIIRMKNVKQYEIEKVMKDKKKEYKDEIIEEILKKFIQIKEGLKI